MGAEQFSQTGKGKTADEAFRTAVDAALYAYGHAGYTGTLAEKDQYVLIVPTEEEVTKLAGRPSTTGTHADAMRAACARFESDGYVAPVLAHELVDAYLSDPDERVDDKWGPAGCLEYGTPDENGVRQFIFFGWASS